jgi:predicted nucleic acid-binding protein
VIVVDSTVWIDFFRGRVTRETTALRSLMGVGVILVGDLVLAEVLQGFPDEGQAEAGRRTLQRFTVEPMVGRESPSRQRATTGGCGPRGSPSAARSTS